MEACWIYGSINACNRQMSPRYFKLKQKKTILTDNIID